MAYTMHNDIQTLLDSQDYSLLSFTNPFYHILRSVRTDRCLHGLSNHFKPSFTLTLDYWDRFSISFLFKILLLLLSLTRYNAWAVSKRNFFRNIFKPADKPGTGVCCKKMSKVFATVSEFLKVTLFARTYMNSTCSFLLHHSNRWF